MNDISINSVVRLLSWGILALFSVPVGVSAQVVLTEIMYAPEGADATHEWVEVCNTGSESVDISGWKFFENDTNHSLSLVSGSSALATGNCAVVADNASVFSADWPGFSGVLFDSAFSLSNTGETLALKNDAGDFVDTATYSQDDGAKDDGNSLHVLSGVRTAGTPTPGIQEGVTTGGSSSTTTATSTNTTNTSAGGTFTQSTVYSYQTVTIQPPEDVHVRVPQEINTTVGSTVYLTLESYDAKGDVVTDGRATWAFGDGAQATGRTVSHRYVFAGEYTVTVMFEQGSLHDEQYIDVTVVPLEAEFVVASDGSWVAISNKSETSLDVSNWRIVSVGQSFSIPEGTIIGAGTTVRFPTQVTKLARLLHGGETMLVYPNGRRALVGLPESERVAVAATSTPLTLAVTGQEAVSNEMNGVVETKTILSAVRKVVPASQQQRVAQSVIGTPAPRPVEPRPESAFKGDAEPQATTQQRHAAAAVLGTESDIEGTSKMPWYVFLALLLIISSVGVVLARSRKLVVDGFEIVETYDNEKQR